MTPLACGDSAGTLTTADVADFESYSCTEYGQGGERVFSFRCTAAGEHYVFITPTCDLDLVLLDASCDPSAGCLEASVAGGMSNEQVFFDCTAGEVFHVVVEGFDVGSAECPSAEYRMVVDGPGC